MIYNYCTLFDSNFLTRGLAMYESLRRYSGDAFHMYILAFDGTAYDCLIALNLPLITVISMADFETDALKQLKKHRAQNEYCWTCTPSLIRYCLDQYNLDCCTYVDADIYFFSDPSVLIQEMKSEASALITEHRYTLQYDQTETSGIYCVQFMTFNQTHESKQILHQWEKQCHEWCFARCEDGKFGDQKYLDTWPEQFENVHVLQNMGGGVAPWNVQQYRVEQRGDNVQCIDIQRNAPFDLIFYHFHGLRFYEFNKLTLGGYDLSVAVRDCIYKPYIQHVDSVFQKYRDQYPIVPHEILKKESWMTAFLKKIKLKKEEENTVFKGSVL